MRVIATVELVRDELIIHYEESNDPIEYARSVVIKWKAQPAIRRLTEAYMSMVSNYVLRDNHTLDIVTQEDMTTFFSKLLQGDPRDLT